MTGRIHVSIWLSNLPYQCRTTRVLSSLRYLLNLLGTQSSPTFRLLLFYLSINITSTTTSTYAAGKDAQSCAERTDGLYYDGVKEAGGLLAEAEVRLGERVLRGVIYRLNG